MQIIRKCMSLIQEFKNEDTVRNYNIDMAVEEHLADQRKSLFGLLEEIEMYPAKLQKSILNYKINYDDEQEMLSREIVNMYKAGETDPIIMLAKLMREACENPSDDDDDSAAIRRAKPRRPKLSCFRKKDSQNTPN